MGSHAARRQPLPVPTKSTAVAASACLTIRRIIAAVGVAGAEVVANVIEIASVIAIAMLPILLLLLLCVAVVAL